MYQASSPVLMSRLRPDAPVKAPLPLTKEARLDAIRARLESGYYERPDVARAVARRMLADVLRKDQPTA
jgi:hypothetical protein